MEQFRITVNYSKVRIIKAKDEESAIKKFKRQLPTVFKKKSNQFDSFLHFDVQSKGLCSGTWHKGCQNELSFGEHGECQACRYDREEDRLNTPG